MSTKQISLIIITLTFASVCFARLEQWPVTQPLLSLAQAEAIGDKAIGEKYKDYFCIRARFALLRGTDQEWELSYTNAKGDLKFVIIEGKGNAVLLERGRDL